MTKFCPHCGAKLNDNANFCGSCGARLISSPGITAKGARQQRRPLSGEDAYKAIQEMFLRKDGRLNRLRYFKRMIVLYCIRFALALILFLLLSDDWGNTSAGVDALIAVVCLVFVYPEYCLTLRRIKDLDIKNLSQAFWFAGVDAIAIITSGMTFSRRAERKFMIIAVGCFIYFIYLLVQKGTDGPNRYGPDPLGSTQE